MKIARISSMQGCRIFRDFTWSDADLAPFGKLNLIYGWNGSGKSTLSHIFRSLELREAPEAGIVSLDLTGRDHPLSGDSFATFPGDAISIKVFNHEFVNATVFRVDGQDITPIFVLGERSAHAQRRIDELKIELDKAAKVRDDAEATETETASQLGRHASVGAKIVKDALGGRGDPAYRNYQRPNFERRAKEMILNEDSASYVLTETEQQRLDTIQRERPRDRLGSHPNITINVEDASSATSALLQRTVLSGDAIQSLLNDPALATWIRDGLELHENRDSSLCLYCERLLPTERVERLRQHFDAGYRQLASEIDSAIAGYREINKQLSAALDKLPPREAFYNDLADAYDTAHASATRRVHQLTQFLSAQITLLEDKREHMREPTPMPDIGLPDNDDPMAPVAEVVERHNRRCDQFDEQIRVARKALEAHFVAEQLPKYKDLSTTREQATKNKEQAAQDVAANSELISDLERQIRDHQVPADRLNEDLRKYLGHDQLQVAVRDHGYAIVRGGEPAQDPSEGERTAIALLYFLGSLEDKDFDLDRGVVVLDDPVSSLDANALYLAFGFIRSRASRAGQLFVLTHNFTFFREVRNWFWYRNGRKWDPPEKRLARSYMLQSAGMGVTRHSRIMMLDPLLRDYESDYHYLFSRVYSAAKNPQGDLEANYELPNICRRLLEGFLAFKYPSVGSERFWEKMDRVEFDEVKKAQIYRFVNAYSHHNAINAPEHDLSQLSETRSVLTHVLELIEWLDGEHYRGLVELADRVSAQSTAE